ncbi:SAM-dependent methyltransferase [Actinomadura viridis]|uniref:SAM-dependent methyltransferase n=1 Tax=Actinomadura viridis TaxID=58110 RepID=A0A931DPM0_9ACTN|nr:SAM-dependent methyltransferase [Actinomadura viridis]MBG6093775.1 SAM-dependent methyltransferase [Actinomadura viridis]
MAGAGPRVLEVEQVADDRRSPAVLGMHAAHPARLYDYYLGGRDSFEADRRVAEEALAVAPELRAIAAENRAFLRRAVRHLVDAGIRQFLDIGTGLPTRRNVHEMAQEIAPETRVVYVDNDPVVIVHARALLTAHRQVPGEEAGGPGPTAVVEADVREPERILADPDVRGIIDFGRPLAILITSVLQFVPDPEPATVVAPFRDAMAPGGHLVLSHPTQDLRAVQAARVTGAYKRVGIPTVTRPKAEIERAFEGFGLLDPGIVQLPLWRPDGPVTPDLDRIWMYGAVGRKL